MYQWNYFFGAIMLDSDYEGFLDFLQNRMKAKDYYYFHPDIFSKSTLEIPYCYENALISFGRTAKWFLQDEYQLHHFIREFEDILNHLDFEHAQVRAGTVYSEYSFFWMNKKKLEKYKTRIQETEDHFKEYNIRYYENEHFFFGLGDIELSTGWCERKTDDAEDFDLQYPDFKYPVEQINS